MTLLKYRGILIIDFFEKPILRKDMIPMKKQFRPVRVEVLYLDGSDVLTLSDSIGGGSGFLPSNPGEWDTNAINSKKGQ